MKRVSIYFIIVTITCILIYSGTKEENIKLVDDVCEQMDDIRFMEFCYSHFDVNNDGKVSMTEAQSVKEFSVINLGITSLKGIEYFYNITTLYCFGNRLVHLDVSKCTLLEILDCSCNMLVDLNVSNCKSLKKLYCQNESSGKGIVYSNGVWKGFIYSKEGNKITTLDVSGCPILNVINCSGNNINSLKLTNCNQLSSLYCSYNDLTSLDLSSCTLLKGINCENNKLTNINLSKCTELQAINCEGNSLSQLDCQVCYGIQVIFGKGNPLTNVILKKGVTPLTMFGESLFQFPSGCNITYV